MDSFISLFKGADVKVNLHFSEGDGLNYRISNKCMEKKVYFTEDAPDEVVCYGCCKKVDNIKDDDPRIIISKSGIQFKGNPTEASNEVSKMFKKDDYYYIIFDMKKREISIQLHDKDNMSLKLCSVIYSGIPEVVYPFTNLLFNTVEGDDDDTSQQLSKISSGMSSYLASYKRMRKPSVVFGGDNNKRMKLEEDSFVKIMNSLVEDTDVDFLRFKDDSVKVFQFPKRMILTRDCYKVMYEDIIKIMRFISYPTVVIRGQPGIGKTSFLYYLLHCLKTRDDYRYHDRDKTIERKIKGIYIVKGKKNGSKTDKVVYELDQKTQKVSIKKNPNLSNVTESIIIVDTYSGEFNPNNIVISISSPDEHNIEEYTNRDDPIKLYFETLSYEELEKWFDKCIDIDRDKKFKDICEAYGNIPRQIYFHHLYKKNYGRDYWKYYVKLIDSVVGTIGYNNFVGNYMKESQLTKNNGLSNIILRYDYKKEMNVVLGHEVLVPKDHLKFISEKVEKYIVCKFYPPKNESEYDEICDYYEQLNNDIRRKENELKRMNNVKEKEFTQKEIAKDKVMKRIAMKQMISYELSMEIIKLNVKEDKKFMLNYEKPISFSHPDGGKHYVYIILDENNYFDLIMNGIFIKIFLDDDELSIDERRITESIKEYNKCKECQIKCCFLNEKRTQIFPNNVKPKPKGKTNENSNVKKTKSNDEDDVFTDINDKSLYLMRKCFYSILNLICPEDIDISYPHQKNYLIFGQTGIGKSILANVIKEYIHEKRNGVVKIKHKNKNGKRIEGYNEDKIDRDYIIISDGGVIGEDDYGDAKMIILLADPSDEKFKTFESKRCPLVMYIPPFTKEEVEDVIILENPKYNIPTKHFLNRSELREGLTALSGDIKGYEKRKDLYRKNYEYYGGVIGNIECDEETIKSKLNEMKKENKLENIINGINVCSLSKGKYNKVLIYETCEEDVTESNHLIFISETIQQMAKKILFKNN